MKFKQGDIVIVNFPFTDLSNYKPRPAIIVSNPSINVSGDYIIVMLTTQEIRGGFCVKISNSDVTIPFNPPHDTMYVYCKKIATLSESIVKKKITEIKNKEKLEEIVSKIKKGLDIV